MARSADSHETALPSTREELLALHRAARADRNAAVPGSAAWERAVEQIARIEVQVARVERAADPPRC